MGDCAVVLSMMAHHRPRIYRRVICLTVCLAGPLVAAACIQCARHGTQATGAGRPQFRRPVAVIAFVDVDWQRTLTLVHLGTRSVWAVPELSLAGDKYVLDIAALPNSRLSTQYGDDLLSYNLQTRVIGKVGTLRSGPLTGAIWGMGALDCRSAAFLKPDGDLWLARPALPPERLVSDVVIPAGDGTASFAAACSDGTVYRFDAATGAKQVALRMPRDAQIDKLAVRAGRLVVATRRTFVVSGASGERTIERCDPDRAVYGLAWLDDQTFIYTRGVSKRTEFIAVDTKSGRTCALFSVTGAVGTIAAFSSVAGLAASLPSRTPTFVSWPE